MSDNCCICGTVKNCEKYLHDVFYNIKKISTLFNKCTIIIYYDDSNDKTYEKLQKYRNKFNMVIYHNKTFRSPHRTHRLANGRNICIDIMNRHFSDYKYFIMMDFDDVCSKPINLEVLKSSLENESSWDSLSFNRNHYYDIWALSIRPYNISFAHFDNPTEVYHKMVHHVKNGLQSLEPGQYLQCISAFNGFSIYKTANFLNCKYDGKLRLDLLPLKYISETIKETKSEIVFKDTDWLHSEHEDCEHRSFHLHAILKNKARIRISPQILFE